MSEQVTLIMPCFRCDPPCLWPPSQSSTIRVSVAQFFAQACINCIELNITYLPTFFSKVIVPPLNVICVYEQQHPAGTPCGVQLARLVVSRTAIGDVLIQFLLVDILGFQFARWQITLTPAQAATNGPFDLAPASITFALCTQITTIPVVLVAVP